MKGRADTKEKKEQVLRRLLEAWEKAPALRLGQLLFDAQVHARKDTRCDYFSIEDETLAEICENFVNDPSLQRGRHGG